MSSDYPKLETVLPSGWTKREELARAAMLKMIEVHGNHDYIAIQAVRVADDMLSLLNKPNKSATDATQHSL